MKEREERRIPGPMAVIGLGHLGVSLVKGCVGAGIMAPGEIRGWDIDPGRLEEACRTHGIAEAENVVAAVAGARYVLLAVKPFAVGGVLRDIAGVVDDRALVISMAAGVPLERMRGWLGERGYLVRVMPNIAVANNDGALAVAFEDGLPAEVEERTEDFLSTLGLVVKLQESYLGVVTGLSGSGPAYVSLLVEAMAEAGVASGLPWELSLRLTLQTFLGTARLLLVEGEDPALFKRRVVTPAGTTAEGLKMLEAGGIRHSFLAAIEAAAERAKAFSHSSD